MNFSVLTINGTFLLSYLVIMAWFINKNDVVIKYVSIKWDNYINEIQQSQFNPDSKINSIKKQKKSMISKLYMTSFSMMLCWFVAALILQVILLRLLPISFLNATLLELPLIYGILIFICIMLNGFLNHFKPFINLQLRMAKKKYNSYIDNAIRNNA